MKRLRITIIILAILFSMLMFTSCASITMDNPPDLNRSIEKIELNLSNVKRQYRIGDEFDSSNIVVHKIYYNGDVEEALNNEIIIDDSGFDSTKAGSYAILVFLSNDTNITSQYTVTVQPHVFGYYVKPSEILSVNYVNLHLQDDMIAVYKNNEYEYELNTVDSEHEVILQNSKEKIVLNIENDSVYDDGDFVGKKLIGEQYIVCFSDINIDDIVLSNGEKIPYELFALFEEKGLEVYTDSEKKHVFDRESQIHQNTVLYVLPNDKISIDIAGYYFSYFDSANTDNAILKLIIKDDCTASYMGSDYSYSLDKLSKDKYSFKVAGKDFQAILSSTTNEYEIFEESGIKLNKTTDICNYSKLNIYDGDSLINQLLIRNGSSLDTKYIFNETIKVLAFANGDMYTDEKINRDTKLFVADINYYEEYWFEDYFMSEDAIHELYFTTDGYIEGSMNGFPISTTYTCRYYKYQNKYELIFNIDGEDYNVFLDNGTFTLPHFLGDIIFISVSFRQNGCILML